MRDLQLLEKQIETVWVLFSHLNTFPFAPLAPPVLSFAAVVVTYDAKKIKSMHHRVCAQNMRENVRFSNSISYNTTESPRLKG